MADHQCKEYSDIDGWSFCVCAVDDAWFEGAGQHAPLFRLLGLGGIHNSKKSLSKLIEKIEGSTSHAIGDLIYLETLAAQCRENGFSLRLCNFEGLKKHWSELNSKGFAILLDINYTNSTSGAHEYGLHLIHDLLNGQRATADIYIVSGATKALDNLLEKHFGEPSWEPLRCIPSVSKEPEKLSKALTAFGSFIKKGNKNHPIATLLRTLSRANSEHWSHPEQFDEVPNDLPLRSLYKFDDESIKALYHYKQREPGFADYRIQPTVLASLLRTGDFPVEIPAENSPKIRLPWAPFGIFWVITLLDLLNSLNKHRLNGQSARFELNNRTSTFIIPLNEELSGDFREAVEGGGRRPGKAVDALAAVKLLTFTDSLLSHLYEGEREEIRKFLKSDFFKEGSTYSVSVDSNNVSISWKGIIK